MTICGHNRQEHQALKKYVLFIWLTKWRAFKMSTEDKIHAVADFVCAVCVMIFTTLAAILWALWPSDSE